MTLLDAKDYDEQKEQQKRRRIIRAVLFTLVVVFILELAGSFLLKTPLWFLYWPEERIASHFFDALQRQDYEGAYGIWLHDPEWRQHRDQPRIKNYPYNEFYQDWGPGSEWGVIKSHKIYAAGSPPGGGSGVIVDMIVNDRAQPARVWIEKRDKTMSFSPI